MKFELIGENTTGQKIYGRIDEDGLCRYTCTEDDPAYQAWLNPKDEQSGTLTNQGGLN